MKPREKNTGECTATPTSGRSHSRTFLLPGGYVDEHGVSHREVDLNSVTGLDEELLAEVQPAVCSARIVTALLTRCVKRVGLLEPVTASLIGDLLVGDREFLMLKLREMTLGTRLDAVVRCPAPDCGVRMDLKLNLDDFCAEAAPISSLFFALDCPDQNPDVNEISVEFRLPTGADQDAVALGVGVDEASAVRKLLARTISRINSQSPVEEQAVATLPEGVQRRIEEQMEKLAPQGFVELEITCLECQELFSVPFDPASFFLAEIMGGRQSLEREVHFLAWHYHWRERDILALPRRKRRRYIELIHQEALGMFTAETHSRGGAFLE